MGRTRLLEPDGPSRRLDRFTPAMERGPDLVAEVSRQWQQGKIQTIWPTKAASAKISYPAFVRPPA